MARIPQIAAALKRCLRGMFTPPFWRLARPRSFSPELGLEPAELYSSTGINAMLLVDRLPERAVASGTLRHLNLHALQLQEELHGFLPTCHR